MVSSSSGKIVSKSNSHYKPCAVRCECFEGNSCTEELFELEKNVVIR